MTSTSRTRRALLAGTVAAGTAFALAVPLLGTASAAHIATFDLSPAAASGAAGTCLPYTITLTPTVGNSVAAQQVDVVLTETAADLPGAVDADFCAPTSGTSPQAAPDQGTGTDSGGAGTTDRAEFTTDANGVVTFGVTSSSPSTINIQAFYEPPASRNNTFDAGEFTDSSTATFGAGGPAGSNAAADAVTVVDSPPTVTGFVGEPLSIAVTLRNGAAQTVAGVTPSADITAGPSAAVTPTCTPSNNDGVSTCTYTPVGAGSDAILFYVNQSDDLTNGPAHNAANEPSDTTTATIAAAVTGLQVDLTCSSPVAADTSAENCVNLTSDPTQVFTATVTAADGVDVGTDRDPVNGVLVRFTENGADASFAPTSCTTAGAGTCSVTLTEATPTSGEVITVLATIAGQNAAGDPGDGEISSDSGTLTFTAVPGAARIITLTPVTTTTQAGGVATFTATVTDASGQPVSGVTVTFSETGAGFFRTPATVVTNAAGQATVESTSSSVETGSQTVTATIDQASTDCELNPNSPNQGNPAGACSDSSTNTFTAATPTPTPTATVSPTATATPTQGVSCTGGPATVTLSANSTQITAGNAPLLSGTVSNAAGARCRSVNVTIFKKSYAEPSYTALATVTTDPNGQFTLVVRPLSLTAYGANTAGDAQRSNIVVIRVYTRINIDSPAVPSPVNSARVVTNPVNFRGTMLPGYSNVAIGLATLLDSVSGNSCFAVSPGCRFSVLQQTTTNSSGAWSITRTLRRGPGVYIIFTSAHQGTDKGSKSITLDVQ